jgi:hypothetical protein
LKREIKANQMAGLQTISRTRRGLGKIGFRVGNTVAALGFSFLVLGCHDSRQGPPTFSTGPEAPSVGTPPAPPLAEGILYGVVFEMTAGGRTPIQGATVYVMSCGANNCPGESTVGYDAKTDKDGGYRIAGLYIGSLNYVWISKEGYSVVSPMAPGTCGDGCDRSPVIKGESRLDVELARR